jgi:hypothetical protein
MELTQTRTRQARVIRWIARIWSLLTIIVLLLFFFGEADFSGPIRITPQEWLGILFFPVGIVLGMVLAWWKEGVGAAVTVGSLVAFYLWDLLGSGTFPSGPFFILFALPGFLFGVAWWLTNSQE